MDSETWKKGDAVCGVGELPKGAQEFLWWADDARTLLAVNIDGTNFTGKMKAKGHAYREKLTWQL